MGPRVHTKTKNLPAAFREKTDATAAPQQAENLEYFLQDTVPLSLDGRRGNLLYKTALRDGRVRSEKVIHLPTMGVYLFSFAHFDDDEKQRLDQWGSLPDPNSRRLAIAHSSQSTGFVSLISEAALETLDGLSTSVGGLPEVCLREVASAVLEALEPLHEASPPIAHGRICGKAVGITDKGEVKLDAMVGALDDKRVNPRGDLFDLGLTLILAALGGDEVFRCRLNTLPKESGTAQWDTLQLLRDELKSQPAPATLKAQNSTYPSMWTVPWLQLVMFNRLYSTPLFDFLHKCFSAESGRELRNHPFLQETEGAWPVMLDMQKVRVRLNIEQRASAQPAVQALLKALSATRLPESFRSVAPHFSLAFRVDPEDIQTYVASN